MPSELHTYLRAHGAELPPEPWQPMSVHRDRPVERVQFGPKPKPTREVSTDTDDDGRPIAWRTLSDDELSAWQREYDADPDKHGGTAIVQGAPGPLEVVWWHPPTGSEVRARWMNGRWHAFDVELLGGSHGTPDTSWLQLF